MSERSAFQRFTSELRRRHVPQTAAVYLVAAWAAIEFSDVVVPNLHLPQWVVPAVIVAAGVGFPVVLVLAWMFDWDTEGVHRTGPGLDDAEGRAHPDALQGADRRPAMTPWFAVLSVLAVGIASALAVAALLAGEGGQDEAAGAAGDDGRAPTVEEAAGGTADEPGRSDPADRSAPEGPPVPGSPGLVGVDSLTRQVMRRLNESGLAGLEEIERWVALADRGALGAAAADSTGRGAAGNGVAPDLRGVARQVAEEAGLSVLIQEPSHWRLGQRVPTTVGEGDTLLVRGIAQDTMGVLSVSVDGEVVAESDGAKPLLAFTTRLVGRPAVGLRDVPIVVRTADGRTLRTVYSIATPSQRSP